MNTKERIAVQPYDVTPREGPQTQGVSLTEESKIRIVKKLDEMGFPFIEGGWPGANPTDSEFFRRMRSIHLRHSLLVAFGSTMKANETPQSSKVLKELLLCETPVVTVFGKNSLSHVKSDLGTTGDRNLEMVRGTMGYLSQYRRIFYDAEHFFDGFMEDPEYSLQVLEAAKLGGAEVVILCDTNGGSTPEFISEATAAAKNRLGEKYPLGIHIHNDSGYALNGTIAAVKAGARQVQGTINGLGERCGNLDLLVFQADAVFKHGMDIGEFDLRRTVELARFIEMETGVLVDPGHPYTGRRAFTDKAGTHMSALRKNPRAYHHIDPSWVGAEMSVEHSDQGGSANILEMADRFGYKLEKSDPKVQELVAIIKEKKVLGHAQQFLMLRRVLCGLSDPFDILPGTRIIDREGLSPEAMVKIRVNGDIFYEAATGKGGLHAFDEAIKKALWAKYPEVFDIKLLDYKAHVPAVRTLSTDETVTVEMEFGHNGDRWTSKVSSADEAYANRTALIDGYKYWILQKEVSTSLLKGS